MKKIGLILLAMHFVYVLTAHPAALAGLPPALLPVTGQTQCYSVDGWPIACDGTGQDGDEQAGQPWPVPRFSSNVNGTLTDNLTGLVWMEEEWYPLSGTWAETFVNAAGLQATIPQLIDNSVAGQWRTPNARELLSVARTNMSAGGPLAISAASPVWSSTTYAFDTTQAWRMDSGGQNFSHELKSVGFRLRPVRDGGLGTIALPATGQKVSATPGDDGALQKGVPWPNPRFSANPDQTVTDNLTGLVWSAAANTPGPAACGPGVAKTWQGALDHVKCLNRNSYLGYGDWRLPNWMELVSLPDFGRANSVPWLNTQGFTGAVTTPYWTSSSWAGPVPPVPLASIVYLGGGLVTDVGRSQLNMVWPVRGGQFRLLDSLVVSGGSGGKFKFGTLPQGAPAPFRDITLANNGAVPLTVGPVALSGVNAADFGVAPGGSQPCPSTTPTLAAGAGCTLRLTFSPALLGSRTATLAVGANGKSLVMPLSATVVPLISGRATDHATGTAVAGATVTVDGGSTTFTDASGGFAFSLPPDAGSHTVGISKSGYQTRSVTVVTSPAEGTYLDLFLATAAAGGGTLPFTLPAQQLPTASNSVAYRAGILAAGGVWPYTFSVVSGALPEGLTLDSATGLISGFPYLGSNTVSTRTYSCTIGVSDGTAATLQVPVSITVQKGTNLVELPMGQVGDFYTATAGVASGTITGTFPTWCNYNPNTHTISGTPTGPGEYRFDITYSNAGVQETITYHLKILGRIQLVTDLGNPNRIFTIGAQYALTYKLNAINGVPPYTFTYPTSGAVGGGINYLPPGLVLERDGTLHGTANGRVPTNTVYLEVLDSSGYARGQTFTLGFVNPDLPDNVTNSPNVNIYPLFVPEAHVGQLYVLPFWFTGGCAFPGIFTRLISLDGRWPGLDYLANQNVLRGVPTTAGIYNLELSIDTVCNTVTYTSTKTFTLHVVEDSPDVKVSLAGAGAGQVSVTNPPPCGLTGICYSAPPCTSGECTYRFLKWSPITLKATPSVISTFRGWSGDCTGTGDCNLFGNIARNVTAVFDPLPTYQLDLTVNGNGSVQIFPYDITCPGGTCSQPLPRNATLSLVPSAGVDAFFDFWSGACTGSGPCDLQLTGPRTVAATFTTLGPLRIAGTPPAYFTDLITAYAGAVNGDVIEMKEGILAGPFTTQADISVTFRGGYSVNYSSNPGVTLIQGGLTIQNGTVIADRIVM